MSIWFLVADSSRAKFFSAENSYAPLIEIEGIAHPEGRLHEGDLVSDAPGSDGGGGGQGRHVIDNRTSAKEQEESRFAGLLADRLNCALGEGEYNRLVIAAPSSFLGVLRNHLNKGVSNKLINQVDKNLIQQPAETLRQYL